MLISISAIESGDFVFLETNTPPPREGSRRLTRTATLDGGAVITDGGVTDADRSHGFYGDTGTGNMYGRPIWTMFQGQDLVHLSCPEGVFSGYLQRVKITASGCKYQLYGLRKIDVTTQVFRIQESEFRRWKNGNRCNGPQPLQVPA